MRVRMDECVCVCGGDAGVPVGRRTDTQPHRAAPWSLMYGSDFTSEEEELIEAV